MSDEVAQLAYAGEYDRECDFTYINVKTGKENTHRTTIYEAVVLAEERRDDRRYRNYEFYIS